MTKSILKLWSRRGLLRLGAVLVTAAALGVSAPQSQAMSANDATQLVNSVVSEINSVINGGGSDSQKLARFQRIMLKYADMPTIARTTLGPPARSASAAQMQAFTSAFQSYLARKWAVYFEDMRDGRLVIKSASPWKSHYEVRTTAIMTGEQPFPVIFRVSDQSGRDLIFDLIIQGYSLLKAEKDEIGDMLDARGGDLDRLIADLR